MRPLVFVLPLVLIAIKVAEIGVYPATSSDVARLSDEHLTRAGIKPRGPEYYNSRWTLAPELGFGIVRRLDDASFWTVLAILLAGTSIARLHRAVIESNRLISHDLWGILPMMLLLIIYLHRMYITGGTFGWIAKIPSATNCRDYAAIILQVLEGSINVVFLGVTALTAVRLVRIAQALNVTQKSIASALLTACVSPFAIIFTAFTIFKIVSSEAGLTDEPSMWFGVNLVGQLAVPCITLTLAALLAMWRWRRFGFCYSFVVGKEVLAIRVH